MQIERIKIANLQVNRANDRHGELENETAAIAWLFNDQENKMKKLAQDIVSERKVYLPPLVAKEGNKFLVFDGNRRVTCLKLLDTPSRAPTTKLQAYFRKLRADWKEDFPCELLCQVEEDRDHIDGILYRLHTGTQSGVGQSKWDDRMKDNFVARSGKTIGFNVAGEIEQILSNAKMLPAKKIPRSNLNRFLSSELIRNRVGFSGKKKKLSFTHDPNAVRATLKRIADDFSEGRVVLGDIWNNDGKLKYLEKLEAEEVLPTDSDVIVGDKKDGPELKSNPKSKIQNEARSYPTCEFDFR